MPTFPSPFGVRVLKYEKYNDYASKLESVSVPFRGSCSEINAHLTFRTEFMDSFRPLSGFVF